MSKENDANFTPNLGDYKSLQPFRFWCQKVLPLVYEDSLSYYELLCKVVDYLNKTMEDVETLHGDVTNLHKAYVELQGYVNNYFNNLDVQNEINNKLDSMASDGTLLTIITPTISSATASWLSEHITNPANPPIDTSLTVSGAAADAEKTGDYVFSNLGGNSIVYGEPPDNVNPGSFGEISGTKSSVIFVETLKKWNYVSDDIKKFLKTSYIFFVPFNTSTNKKLLKVKEIVTNQYLCGIIFYNEAGKYKSFTVQYRDKLIIFDYIDTPITPNNIQYGNNNGDLINATKFGDIDSSKISLIWNKTLKGYSDVSDDVKAKISDASYSYFIPFSPAYIENEHTLTESSALLYPVGILLDFYTKSIYFVLYTDTLSFISQPISEAPKYYNEVMAFQRIGCIGDSTMNGVCDQYPSGTKHNLKYSWITHFKKLTGCYIDNYSIAGTSATSWCTSDDGLKRFIELDVKAQLFLLGIGINNYQETGVGDITDINTENPELCNKNTFCGAYGYILINIHKLNPKARIMMFTIATVNSAKNDKIKEIANMDYFNNFCVVCDLYNEYRSAYSLFSSIYTISTVHPIEIGYAAMSDLLKEAVSKTIRQNYSKFYNLFDIEYSDTDSVAEVLPIGY